MPDPSGQSGALRIIDANLNRAREALRVMEDYARFILDDDALSGALKDERHALTADVPPGVARRLTASRDTARDVGRTRTAGGECHRPGAADVALAGGRRLAEALRAIEEYAKTLDVAWALRVERMRYRGYHLDQRLRLHARARERFGSVRLYVLITESMCRGDWLQTAEAALRGGADALQLRETGLSDRDLAQRASRLARCCRDHDALLIVNDRPDIALISGAAGVHLGTADLTVADARRILPDSAVVGVSTHTIQQVQGAVADAPDYIAVGPMFPTTTKPQSRVAGPETLAAARALTSLPLVAIGGIDVDTAADVLSAAPCGLAVCRAVIAQPDVRAAAAALRTLIDRHADARPTEETRPAARN
ncbi:MAG: thiamine phosphate synthase [Phycisphaerae bacterium]